MSGEAIGKLETRRLEGWGEVGWSRLVEAADGMTCAWADYEGFHIGPCPAQAPPYSHIWGWNADGTTLFRGRIDAGRVTVGWLRAEGGDGEPVDCVAHGMFTWRPDHERLRIRSSGELIPPTMRAIEVLGPRPVTFVSA